MLDASLTVYKEHSVRFETCPVAGHNAHGLVERKIKTAQELLEKSGIATSRMHTTGLQTAVKLAENMMNNTPYGCSFGRSKSNSKLMKLISQNMMKIGRINSRTLNGPVRLPEGPATMMKKVEETYQIFYKIYNDTMVARMIMETQPKWFRTERDLKVGDVVYFRKSEGSAIKGSWTTGVCEEVTRGKDGLIREATVKYFNSSEETPRYTTRSVRTLVRLFNVEDSHWREDMAEVEKLLVARNIKVELGKVDQMEREVLYGRKKRSVCEGDPTLCRCCCASHCSLSLHVSRGDSLVKQEKFEKPQLEVNVVTLQDGSDYKLDSIDDYLTDEATMCPQSECFGKDSFMSLITSLNVNLAA